MATGIRPTEARVKKAIFDILGDVSGLSFLDLFAGSGAVGMRALSYGAKKAVFVENNKNALNILRKNMANIQKNLSVSILSLDVYRAVKKLYGKEESFDIIFLDPPYCRDMAKKTLQTLDGYDILAPCGYIVVEHFKKDILPDIVGNLVLFKQAKYGDTSLSFYRKVASSK